ncbi:hypothetical protein [Flavobacterium glycines]|nr:hypothetical protein [Flavobacterium glycines]
MPDIEKIYLHTDRNVYFTGEDLWYKAYVVRASNNLLFDLSGILYVELISSNSDIIIRNKTSLEMGLGHGDFQLQDSLDVKPGKYQLRAYTNWNRNFGDDFVFKKDIEIIDLFESHDKSQSVQNNVTESKSLKKRNFTNNPYKIAFFPESGSLLENVASVIGFKAVDLNGKPIAITGTIYDSDNELVSTFESVHDGMGKTQLLPIEGKSYYAKIKTKNGFEFQQDLPKASQSGYALSYRNFKGRNIVTINTNQQTLVQNPNATLIVICKSRGVSYLETTQTLTETSLSFELPKDKIPDGISQITLFDNVNKPQSERLVYFEKEPDLEVQFSIDKTSYQPEEKVTLNVSSKSKSGEGKSASFSLSVTDTNGVEEDNYDSNICSYFLMESDIRGKVYHPAYYFDSNNLKRLEHLDNLLLTQGWRDFVWKISPKIDDKNSYKAEKGITISGRVKQLFADKPLVNNNVTLALMGEKNNGIFSAVTDSIGRFQFEKLMFSGKTNMQLNARNEKGKFAGEIVLDPIEQARLPIFFKNESINFTETTQIAIENVFKKYTGLNLKPEGVLSEVAIVGKENRVQPFDFWVGARGFTYNRGADTDSYLNIFDLLSKKIPDVTPFKNFVRFLNYKEPPLFTLDGQIVLLNEISNISLSDIGSIWATADIKGVKWYGEESPYGLIAIWTKSFSGNQPSKNQFSSISKRMEGFYAARVFYSLDPEKLNPELDKNTVVRNTIYWNPYVHPDKTGNMSMNYFNSSVETKVKVALEGITGSGIPVVRNTYYSIKK